MNAYDPGPLNWVTRWLPAIAVLVVLAACILATLWYQSTDNVGYVCHDGNCPGAGVPQVTPYVPVP